MEDLDYMLEDWQFFLTIWECFWVCFRTNRVCNKGGGSLIEEILLSPPFWDKGRVLCLYFCCALGFMA